MARRSKLTKEIQKEVCKHIENGNTFERSAILSGLCEATFYEWKKRGREDLKAGEETKYTEFLEAVKKSEEVFKATHIKNIAKASNTHWQASAWLLERKYFEEFGRKDRHHVTGNFSVENFDVPVEDEEKYKKRMEDMFGGKLDD